MQKCHSNPARRRSLGMLANDANSLPRVLEFSYILVIIGHSSFNHLCIYKRFCGTKELCLVYDASYTVDIRMFPVG